MAATPPEGATADRLAVPDRLRESVRKAAQRPDTVASDYRWDAFISYHRDPDFDRWMTKVFGILRQNLANHLGGKANIFIDVRDIELGDRWTDELKDALRTSKCLIPFISPAYFASRWCSAEFDTFRMRKQAPITPIAIHPIGDGAWIPDYAQSYQMLDLAEYHLQTLAFGASERATELEIHLKKHAAAISRKILKAPPFRNDFHAILPVEPLPVQAPLKKARAARKATGTRHAISAKAAIFINTPFSASYRPVLDAILFTILSFGYVPRSVLDPGFGGETRLERIFELIGTCPLALHDLSESRMNGVLELGMFMAARRFGAKRQERSKEFLVVVPDLRQSMISDLAGMDVAVHNMEPQTAILTIANWLAIQPQTRAPVPGAAALWNQYRRFQAELPRLMRALNLRAKDVAYRDVLLMINAWLDVGGLD